MDKFEQKLNSYIHFMTTVLVAVGVTVALFILLTFMVWFLSNLFSPTG